MPLSPYHPLQLALGLAIWFAWFSLMYGGLSLACAAVPPLAQSGPFTWLNGVLLLATGVTTAVLAWWAYRCWRAAKTARENSESEADCQSKRLIASVSAGGYLAAAISTLCVGLTVTALPPCV